MTRLFNDFDAVSSKEWKQKIQVDLKGLDYNDTLIWKSSEGINVKPFYHSDTLSKIDIPNRKQDSWSICQSVFVSSTMQANKKAIDAINRGANSIKFAIVSDTISFEELLKNIDLSINTIHLELRCLSDLLIENLKKLPAKKGIKVHVDLIGNLGNTGNWFLNLKLDHELLEKLIDSKNEFDAIISVDTSLYQNAGANMVQQLAYGLSHANEYLNHYQDKLKQPFNFNVSVGTNYFFEIAKIRALRILWKTLSSEYNLNNDCYISATPTQRNKTIYDYNTNMLRTTTECMSAILGGADSICNLPYDAIYHKDNEFGERIARNQLLILKHESYFDVVKNPSEGAYYIEELTKEIARKALDLFKNIEDNGGFLKQLKEGTIQRKIKESAKKEQQQFNENKTILLGTNKHPNANDKMKDNLELYPFVKTNKRKTLIEPIIAKRLAENLEQERLKNES